MEINNCDMLKIHKREVYQLKIVCKFLSASYTQGEREIFLICLRQIQKKIWWNIKQEQQHRNQSHSLIDLLVL